MITKVIIDDHYEAKHSESINDEIILELITILDQTWNEPEVIKHPYQYYVSEIMHNKKNYKLIWLLEESELYVGVINAYRKSRGK